MKRSTKLTKLYKDPGSGNGGCQTVYLEEGDSDVIDVVIQGDELDQETFAQLENVLPGENAVRIRLDIILGAIERYQEQQRH